MMTPQKCVGLCPIASQRPKLSGVLVSDILCRRGAEQWLPIAHGLATSPQRVDAKLFQPISLGPTVCIVHNISSF